MKKIASSILSIVCSCFYFRNASASALGVDFHVTPWSEIAAATIFFLVIFFGYLAVKIYLRIKNGRISWVGYEIKEGDGIKSLSDKFGISWKSLAKKNKIKAPFILEPGQVILVPHPDSYGSEQENFSEIGNKEAEEPENSAAEIVSPRNALDAEENKKIISGNDHEAVENIALGKNSITEKLSFGDEDKIVSEHGKVSEENKYEDKGGLYNKIITVLLLLILLFAFAGFSFFSASLYLKAKNNQNNSNKVSISEMRAGETNRDGASDDPEVSASQSREEEDRKDSEPESNAKIESKKPEELAIKILNGGAVSGSAGKVKEILISKGYVKAEAKNAEEDGYQGAIIYYSENLEKEATGVKEVLSDKYSKIELKQASSGEEKSGDIVIILGK